MSNQKSLKKNMLWNYTRTFMSLVFPLITFPYASRVLLPEGIGKVNFANSIVQYFAIIAMLGISTYGIRECARCRDKKIEVSKLVKELFTINMISTFVAYGLFAISLFIVPKFQDYKILLVVYSSTILFTTLGMDWLYSALEEYQYITIRSIIFQILSLALLFILVHKREDYIKYAAISVISNVGSNVCNFIHSRKFVSFKTETKLEIKKHLKPIFTLFAMSVTISIYTVLDTTMLGFISGDESVGIYTAATKINKMVLTVITAGCSVLLPRLSYFSDAEDKSKFMTLIEKGFLFVLTLSIPCMVGLFILAKPIILLFSGEYYLSALPAMQIMNPIIFIISISGFIGIQVFMSLRKEKYTLFSVICGCAVNVILNSIFIPKYGATGAAIGTVFAESVVSIIQVIIARKYFNWKVIFKHFIQILFATAVMGGCVYFTSVNINLEILSILTGILVGVLAYGGVLVLIKNKLVISILKSKRG